MFTQFRIWNALLTGSRAYGKPTDDSDIDIVIRVGNDDAAMFRQAFPQNLNSKEYHGSDMYVFNFDKLNLILCTSDQTFEQWMRGTAILKREFPVEREKAVETFKAIRAESVINFNPDKSSDKDIPF